MGLPVLAAASEYDSACLGGGQVGAGDLHIAQPAPRARGGLKLVTRAAQGRTDLGDLTRISR